MTEILDSIPGIGWHAIGIIVCGVLLVLQRMTDRWAPFFIVSRLPSTALHEFSHFLVAWLTFGKPTFPSLLPTVITQNTPKGKVRTYELGSVTLRKANVLSSVPTAVAPLMMLPAAGYILGAISRDQINGWKLGVAYLVIFWMVQGCWPSKPDWRIVLHNPLSLIFWIGISAGVFQSLR